MEFLLPDLVHVSVSEPIAETMGMVYIDNLGQSVSPSGAECETNRM